MPFFLSMFDTEKFISEIEQRPSIYDVQCKEYSNREMKAQCWAEVGEAMYPDWYCIPRAMRNTRGKKEFVFINDYKGKERKKIKKLPLVFIM